MIQRRTPLKGSTKPIRRSPLKRTTRPTVVRTKAKAPPLSHALRAWGMPEYIIKAGKKALRFANPIEKGVYWYWFARVRRAEDCIKYGVCVSCGRPLDFENSQGGHFVPASNCGAALLFHPKNVNAECEGCNGFDEGHLIGYAINLEVRYGTGIVAELVRLKKQVNKHMTVNEYRLGIAEMRARFAELEEYLK